MISNIMFYNSFSLEATFIIEAFGFVREFEAIALQMTNPDSTDVHNAIMAPGSRHADESSAGFFRHFHQIIARERLQSPPIPRPIPLGILRAKLQSMTVTAAMALDLRQTDGPILLTLLQVPTPVVLPLIQLMENKLNLVALSKIALSLRMEDPTHAYHILMRLSGIFDPAVRYLPHSCDENINLVKYILKYVAKFDESSHPSL